MPRRPGQPVYHSAFGQALSSQLTKANVSQAELSRAVDVRPSYINRLMHDKVSPEWADLIANSLNVSAEDRVKLHRAAAETWGYKLDLTKP